MVYHVSALAAMTGDGSKERPFKTIQEAADRAEAGDTVLVGDGIYRESVCPRFSGTKQKPIVYRAVNLRGAVITGAEVVCDFSTKGSANGKTIYRTCIDNGVFGEYNPFGTLLKGDWLQMKTPLHTAMLFIDGKPMLEVGDESLLTCDYNDENSFEQIDPPGFWCCEVLDKKTVIKACFNGRDPRAARIEATVRRNLFMPEKNGVDYITLSGFKCTMAATQWAPPTAWQDGAVGPNWAKGWVIEDCEVSFSRCSGISLGKYLQPENENKWTTRHLKHGTQTEREAVCQAVNDGFSRERIGSHIIKGCDIHDCGQTGIVGHMGCAFSVIEDNHIHHINNRRDVNGAEIGGIKLHAAIDTIIARNHIHHCTRGVWLDWQAQGTRFSANLLHDNMPYGIKPEYPTFGEDIFIEVSHGPTLVDNNFFLSYHSAKLATQGVAFVHNLVAGSFTCVGRGTDNKAVRFPSPRYTPYHVPHSTLIAGFMTINHGDMRFINNIFIQRYPVAKSVAAAESGTENGDGADESVVGTKPYDGYPTEEEYYSLFTDNEAMTADRDRFYDHLPVRAFGNCYFNGAMPYDKETDPWSDREHTAELFLENTPDGLKLVTNVFKLLPEGHCGVVNSDTLGEAFEPEQRFEAPDGSMLIFDNDYHGTHRGVSPVCGPIEAGRDVSQVPLTRRVAKISMLTGHEDETSAESEKASEILQPVEEAECVRVAADIVLTGCDACTFAIDGEQYTVALVYIRGNEVWFCARNNDDVIHLDCEYGFFKRQTKNEVELKAPFVIDVTEDKNIMGIVNTLATMFRILSKNMVQDPELVCERVRDKANESFAAAGITMRFTPQYLKFIKGKKFITLEEVVDTIAAPLQDVLAEIVD